MTRTNLRTFLTVLIVGSVLFAGTAAAATDISGGGAGDAGDLGGASAIDPGTVTEGNTTGNHVLTFSVENVSKDGNSDRIMVTVPNALAEAGLSANGATVENASSGQGVSISSSASLVDGPDGDGVQDTVSLAVSPSGGGAVTLNVQVDVSTTAPAVESEQQYGVTATVQDSDNSTAGPTEFATLTVSPSGMDDGETTTDSGSEETTDGMDGDDGTDSGESTDMGDDGESTEMDGGEDDGEATEMDQGTNGGDATTTSGNGPGFGVIGALAALVGTLFLARRRA